MRIRVVIEKIGDRLRISGRRRGGVASAECSSTIIDRKESASRYLSVLFYGFIRGNH